MLDSITIKLAQGPNYAALTTLFPSGSPQTQVMWVDADEEFLYINTEIHREKYKNIERDSRVSILIWKNDDSFKYVEVRGNVAETIKGKEARDHIDKLSEKYFNKPYPFQIQTERVVMKIKATKEVFFNVKIEDF
jgi:PPOX class probable F420-dependent enzyme